MRPTTVLSVSANCPLYVSYTKPVDMSTDIANALFENIFIGCIVKICGILAILYMLYFPSDLIVNYKQAAHMDLIQGIGVILFSQMRRRL